MYFLKIIINFWHGNISLWKSYWIVGELINAIVIILIINYELKYYGNSLILERIPMISFNYLSFLSKIVFIIWTFFTTVGIWRAAEKYKGKLIWIILTLIVLSYRIFSLREVIYL